MVIGAAGQGGDARGPGGGACPRCYVRFLRNALDHVPHRVDDDCLWELRWLDVRRDLREARRDLATWLAKWRGKYPKLTGWVEETIEETLTFYRLPRRHHKHMKFTSMLERPKEIGRRADIVRTLPDADSCRRSVRALAVETHEKLAGAAPWPEHGGSAPAPKGRSGWPPERPVDNAPCIAHRANPASS